MIVRGRGATPVYPGVSWRGLLCDPQPGDAQGLGCAAESPKQSGAPQGLIPCGSETGLTSFEAAQSAEHTAALCLGRGEGTLQPVSGGGGSFATCLVSVQVSTRPLALAELPSSLWDTSSMASSPSGWVLSKRQGKNPQNKTKLNLLKMRRNRDPRALLEGMGNEGP